MKDEKSIGIKEPNNFNSESEIKIANDSNLDSEIKIDNDLNLNSDSDIDLEILKSTIDFNSNKQKYSRAKPVN